MSKEECRRFEKKLAFHTAPSLLGIKCASLFTLSRSEFDIGGNARRFNRRAAARGLKIKVLREECSCAGRSLILVYSPKLLAARLSAPENRELLREYGYTDDMPLDECLERLSERTKCDDFPHEIGIFLGYPAEDVRDSWRMAAAITSCAAAGKYMAAWRAPAGSSQPTTDAGNTSAAGWSRARTSIRR